MFEFCCLQWACTHQQLSPPSLARAPQATGSLLTGLCLCLCPFLLGFAGLFFVFPVGTLRAPPRRAVLQEVFPFAASLLPPVGPLVSDSSPALPSGSHVCGCVKPLLGVSPVGMQVALFALFSYCLPVFLGAQPLFPLAVVLGGGLLRCPPGRMLLSGRWRLMVGHRA